MHDRYSVLRMCSLVLMIRLCCNLHLVFCLSDLLPYALYLSFSLHLMLIVLAFKSAKCPLLLCYEPKIERKLT